VAQQLCPWWFGYLLASPLRRLFFDPRKLLAPHVRPGMTVLEPGPGMGFFTLDLARLVGPSGRLIVVELQEKMLAGLRRRAARAGLADRLICRLGSERSMGLEDLAGTVDFTLAYAVVHEMPSASGFFTQVATASKPDARVLLREPKGHVSAQTFAAELAAARSAGFERVDGGTGFLAVLARR
jgi:cyclopropane fatty-acyl-phospholipid synthase-like methyltransferase